MRIIAAAIAGGLIVFIWSAFAHIVTPLGTAGLSVLPAEDPVMEAMRTNVPQSGLYFFPGGGMGGDLTPEQQKAWEEKIRTGPTGLIAYHAGGMEPMAAKQLFTELGSSILAAAIAAILVSFMAAPMITKAVAVALMALFAFLTISVSYWAWYNFPTMFVIAGLIVEFVGWFLAGLAIAKIATPKSA